MQASDRLSADKAKLYAMRESFNLYELACLAHGADPELVAYNVHDEVAAHVREVHGDASTRVELSEIAMRVGVMPESTLGPEIGGTLKALCVATGGTFQRAVSRADARRLLKALGLELLAGSEAPEDRRTPRKGSKAWQFLQLLQAHPGQPAARINAMLPEPMDESTARGLARQWRGHDG